MTRKNREFLQSLPEFGTVRELNLLALFKIPSKQIQASKQIQGWRQNPTLRNFYEPAFCLHEFLRVYFYTILSENF
ncbi:MAG: hypothetical protein OXD01_01620, partial [Gammaproteobacteria bacterium]|nr:hypothetical protein [Gammaproteobacteria bacterium]